jgi:hypothetical protein
MADAGTILTTRAAELESIDQSIMGEVVGVAQAVGDMRKALGALDVVLNERHFEQAAALGYGEIASAFIFLQRALGGLQSADLDREAFTSSIAEQLKCSFEDAEPHVAALLQCLKPKPDLSDEERAAAKASFTARIRKMTSNIPE